MYGKAKGFAFVVLHASLLAPLLISEPEAAKHINLDMTHSTGRDRVSKIDFEWTGSKTAGSTERDREQTLMIALERNGPRTTSWRRPTAPQVGPERSSLASLSAPSSTPSEHTSLAFVRST